jgi:hypothetical protein
MRRLLALLSLLSCLSVAARAAEVATPFGNFDAPEGLVVLKRDETLDKNGKPSCLLVFSKANDLPRAVYIVVCSHVEPDPTKPFDPLDGAVKFGNLFDRSLTRDAAKPVAVGGVPGGRFDGLLPHGLRTVSYAAAKGNYRLIVLLKGPANSPYKELTDEFAKGIEGFAWTVSAEASQ